MLLLLMIMVGRLMNLVRMRGYLRAIRVLTFISKSLSNPSAGVILKLFIAAEEPPLDADVVLILL